jgi:hypothetical protein
MPRRNSAKPVRLVFAIVGAACGIASAASAADLAIPPRLQAHAAVQSTPPVAACCAARTSVPAARQAAPLTEAESVKIARAAQAQFRDLRIAMEREMSFREVVPKDKLATLEDDMRQLSTQLSGRTPSGHLPWSSKAGDALKLAQEWYRESLRVLDPPLDGVTELPSPINLSDKADLADAALDRLVEEATAYATAPRRLGSPKKPSSNDLVTGSITSRLPH